MRWIQLKEKEANLSCASCQCEKQKGSLSHALMLIVVLWCLTSITPAVKGDNIALLLGTLNVVGKISSSGITEELIKYVESQTPPQNNWIGGWILTRSCGTYLHNRKPGNYCSRLLIFLPWEILWVSLTKK